MAERKIEVQIVGDATSFVKASDAVARESGQLTGTFDKLQKNAAEANRALEKTPDHLNAAGEAGGDMESAFRGVLDVTGAVTEQFGVALPAGLETGLQGITDIGGGVESFIRGAPGFLAAAVSMTTAIWAQVTALTAQAVAFVVANAPIIAIVAAIALVAAGVVLLIKYWDDLVAKFPILGVALDAVKAKFEEVQAWFNSSFMPGLLALAATFQQAFQQIAGFVDTYLAPAFQKIVSVVGAAGEQVVGFIRQHWGTIEAIFQTYVGAWLLVLETVWRQIQNVFETAFGIITGLTNVFVGIITGDWDRAWLGIKQIVESVIEGIKTTIDIGLDFIVGLFKLLPVDIGGALGDVVKTIEANVGFMMKAFDIEAWKQLGKDIVAGLWNGIQSVWDGLVSNLQDLINKLPDAAKKILGISSPSKVFYQIGVDVVKGFEDGLGAEAPAMIQLGRDIFTDVGVQAATALNDAIASVGIGWKDIWSYEDGSVGAAKPVFGQDYILGSDGKWYPNNQPMPAGVTGASSIPAGSSVATPNVGDKSGNGTAQVTWDGTKWVQTGAESYDPNQAGGGVYYGFGNSAANPAPQVNIHIDTVNANSAAEASAAAGTLAFALASKGIKVA